MDIIVASFCIYMIALITDAANTKYCYKVRGTIKCKTPRRFYYKLILMDRDTASWGKQFIVLFFKTSWTSSECLMYVQFTFRIQEAG